MATKNNTGRANIANNLRTFLTVHLRCGRDSRMRLSNYGLLVTLEVLQITDLLI